MPRLPQPGSDHNKWGDILNEYLAVSHDSNGAIKPSSISPIVNNAVANSTSSLTNQIAAKYSKPSAGIPKEDLSQDLQNAIDSAVSGTAPDATTTSRGVIRLSGDLTGDALNPRVAPDKILGASAGLASHIQAGTITNVNIHSNAAIEKSKLAPLALTNDDIAVGAAIVQGKIQNLTSDLSAKANMTHSHTAADVSSGTLDIARIPTGNTVNTVALGNHQHSVAEISNLQNILNSKADTSHTHTANQITDFNDKTAAVIGDRLKAGSNVSISYDDTLGVTTISSTGGGGGTPSSTVTTVAGRTGDVVLNAGDITDGVFSTNRIPDLPASKITTGTLSPDRVADFPANKISSGTLDIARIPTGTTAGTVAAGVHSHTAADISSGTLDIARIPTGTNNTTVALGNHIHSQYALAADLASHQHDDRYYTETETDAKLNVKLNTSEKGMANGLATLDSNGQLPVGQLPALAIKDTFTVSVKADLVTLNAQRGDMAICTDDGRTYVLAGDNPGTLSDWKELTANAGVAPVTSVAGKTGAVTLARGDIGLDNVDNTADLAKPISTATQSALDNKVGSGNSSITGIELYPSAASLPTVGVTGVLYVVPVE